MFKKLKDKITESSPQRLQQFTQSLSDRLQNSQTSVDENFFTIGEEEPNTSTSSSKDQGFSSVALVSPIENRYRRNSNSSLASDVSFLPRYESGNMYHLQSDLEISASEMEDNASTSSSLGHLTKEQIYSAFQKSQMKYHKYRGRYTDLSRHYKDLEREVTKMKSVLVDTQDKAIRRVNELKEQCNLEQKAKAHLENALRDEIDEQKFKIQTLETKINLLQSGNNKESLIDITDKSESPESTEQLEKLTKYLNDARSEIESLNEKLHELKANSIVFQSKELEYKTKISKLEKEIAQFYEREKENNLILAQNKMELHNELLGKDTEINKLRKELETLKEKEDNTKTNLKLENLQSQNTKLIERIEHLTQKCNNLESDLLKVGKYKIETEELKKTINELNSAVEEETTKVETMKHSLQECQEVIQKLAIEKDRLTEEVEKQKIKYEREISDLRDSAKKGLISLEAQIQKKLNSDFANKEEELKLEFQHKLEELATNNHTTKDMHLQLIEKDSLIKQLTEQMSDIVHKLEKKEYEYKQLEDNHIQLIEDSNKLRNTVANLKKDLSSVNNNENEKSFEDRIERLQANIKTLQDEIIQLKNFCEVKEKNNLDLEREVLKLEKSNQELYEKTRLLEEKQEVTDIDSNESKLLEFKLQRLEEENKSLLQSFEEERKVFNEILRQNESLKLREEEIDELNFRNSNLLSKVATLKWYLTIRESKLVQLSKIKLKYEQDVEKLQRQLRLYEEKDEAVELDKTECSLLKLKLQKLEQENLNLIQSFENERITLNRQISQLSNSEHDTENHNSVPKSSRKHEDYMILAQENLTLKNLTDELNVKVRLSEEKEQLTELEKNESKMLELKLQKLEEEKNMLLKEFEMEREMFNNILKDNTELKVKEEQIADLEENCLSMEEKIVKLKEYLDERTEEIVQLNKIKLDLEREVSKLKGNLRILEEKDEAIEIGKTECNLLQLKVQQFEEEIKKLRLSFELERKSFEEAYNKNAHYQDTIEELTRKIATLKQEKEEVKKQLQANIKNLEDLNASIFEENNVLKHEKNELNQHIKDENLNNLTKINELSEENKVIKQEIQSKINEISNHLKCNEELKTEVNEQRKENNNLINKITSLEESLNKEANIRTELQAKYEAWKNNLDDIVVAKDAEIKQTNANLADIEKNYLNEKDNFIQQIKTVENLQKRLYELESIETNYNALQKRLFDLEELEKNHNLLQTKVARVKDIEKELEETKILLSQRTQEYHNKNKEFGILEQRITLMNSEHEQLENQVTELMQKVSDLTQENNNLEKLVSTGKDLKQEMQHVSKKNDVLQKECDKLNLEMSELKVIISQLNSDNRNITEENSSLINQLEEQKVKNEYLENEKNELENSRIRLETEKQELQIIVEQLQVDKHSQNNAAISDIHEKFENLSADYSKLQEQYSDFVPTKKKLETQILELEHQCNELLHEKQLLKDEIQELKIAPVVQNNVSKLDNLALLQTVSSTSVNEKEKQTYLDEIEILHDKLTKYKSLDLTNKSSMEFYENELDRMKTKNEKLNRKLDETLVTLHHCAELSNSTELEYLRNVLYNYMLGKEGIVLARVIAAVCKFNPEQTEAVIQKEQQKQTLLGQLGIL